VILERALWPLHWLEVSHHQELREREEAKLHAIAIDRPASPVFDALSQIIEIGFRRECFVLGNLWQIKPEIRSQPLLKRQVRYDFSIPRAQIERRSPVISDKLDGQQDKRGLAEGLRALAFVPAQKTHRQVKDVETLLFLRSARVGKQTEQSALECFLSKPRFKELILVSRGSIYVAQVIHGQEQLFAVTLFVSVFLISRQETHTFPLKPENIEDVGCALAHDVQCV
jgi:hypothetical protein